MTHAETRPQHLTDAQRADLLADLRRRSVAVVARELQLSRHIVQSVAVGLARESSDLIVASRLAERAKRTKRAA